MLELLVILAVLALCGAVVIGALKALFWVALLPLKLAAWVLQGILGLVVLGVLVALGVCAATFVLPVFLLVFALPIIAVAAGVIVLVKAFA